MHYEEARKKILDLLIERDRFKGAYSGGEVIGKVIAQRIGLYDRTVQMTDAVNGYLQTALAFLCA